MSVHKKLMLARVKLQNSELKKSGHNKFAGYWYFELGDFLPTTQVIFNELGLCGTISFSAETATLVITDVDGGGTITFTSPMGSAALKGCHEVQNIGAVETYQRRYLWVTAMEIVEHDALDSSEPVKEQRVQASKSKPTDGAMERLTPSDQERARATGEAIQQAFIAGEEWTIREELDGCGDDADFKTAVWSLLDSKCRAFIKKMNEKQPVEA